MIKEKKGEQTVEKLPVSKAASYPGVPIFVVTAQGQGLTDPVGDGDKQVMELQIRMHPTVTGNTMIGKHLRKAIKTILEHFVAHAPDEEDIDQTYLGDA